MNPFLTSPKPEGRQSNLTNGHSKTTEQHSPYSSYLNIRYANLLALFLLAVEYLSRLFPSCSSVLVCMILSWIPNTNLLAIVLLIVLSDYDLTSHKLQISYHNSQPNSLKSRQKDTKMLCISITCCRLNTDFSSWHNLVIRKKISYSSHTNFIYYLLGLHT